MDPDPGISDEAYNAVKRKLSEQQILEARAAMDYIVGPIPAPPPMLTLSASHVLATRSRRAKNIHDNVVAEDHDTIFKLNARALKVFKTIFSTPSIDATTGEVAWNDFLYAMKAVGFAPEAMGGSEWHFHPETVDVKHGIVFHSPHPNPKMPYQVARRHGRDLRRAYGWEGHMFALA